MAADSNTRPESALQGWQPIETAPRDRTQILAVTGEIAGEPWSYLSHRQFVVFHLGKSDRIGLDLGWALFPGMGCSDEWLAGWMPLPPLPLSTRGEAQIGRAHV